MGRSIARWGYYLSVAPEPSAEAVRESAAGGRPGDVGAKAKRRGVVLGDPGRAGVTAYCRRCEAHWPVSAARLLSAHSTSAGVVTYFRCPRGHVILK